MTENKKNYRPGTNSRGLPSNPNQNPEPTTPRGRRRRGTGGTAPAPSKGDE